MERYFKRKLNERSSSSMPKEVDLNNLPSDPAERRKILEYHPNQRDEIRRAYLLKGPCQPRGHDFPLKMIGNKERRFNSEWFDQYGNWLEYSIKEDKAYCLCCYLFRDQFGKQGGSEAFVTEGFSSWNKTERLASHVGHVNSAHNQAVKKCDNLMREKQSIEVAFQKQSEVMKNEYRIRLNASIDASRFLLHQGLPFRGHDESEESDNRGNFLELIKYTATQNETIAKVVLGNAPKNHQMVAPGIQKEIVHCFAQEVVHSVIQEIQHDFFALLVDESSDVSNKEHMAVVLRYVDRYGIVKERFIGIVHVMETSALSLKTAVDSLFADHGLSLKKVRGQGYDGASNMKGEFSGLKTLIMNENESAYYVHCFAHQLQLAVVAVAKKHVDIADFFNMVSTLMNVVGASCKRKDMIRQDHAEKIAKEIASGEIQTGKGLNQELSLKRAGDTRWGSHYKSLLNLASLFSSVIQVLECVSCDASDSSKKAQARGLLKYLQSFDFVFNLQLMINMLGITNELSLALQRKDGDILNAIALVKVAKGRLINIRNGEWESLLSKIATFCNEHNHKIDFLNMEEEYVDPCHPRRKSNITNEYHYRIECYYTVMDKLLLELNDRFNEINSELLHCVSCLNPSDAFGDFDSSKLIRMAEFYPNDFSVIECMALKHQLEIYIADVRTDERFSQLKGLGDLSRLLVQTKKHVCFPLVYRLLKLALILPIATSTVERCFSGMNIIKTDLRNRMSDQFLNDCLVCFIEKELLGNVNNDVVMERFQNMKTRREQLR